MTNVMTNVIITELERDYGTDYDSLLNQILLDVLFNVDDVESLYAYELMNNEIIWWKQHLNKNKVDKELLDALFSVSSAGTIEIPGGLSFSEVRKIITLCYAYYKPLYGKEPKFNRKPMPYNIDPLNGGLVNIIKAESKIYKENK
jgi:hypothetical protein